MGSILVQLPTGHCAGTVDRRLLIGRRMGNDVVVNDLRVSRIHAAIERDGDHCIVTDNASRTGTWVNGQRIRHARRLVDGDEIDIGPARIEYREADEVPAGAAPLGRPAGEARGIAFTCACGNVMWVPAGDAGLRGQCRRCGREVVAPLGEGGTGVATAICAICQCRVEPAEATTACPECGLVFHAECWTENRGCAAYGCGQVGALEPGDGDPGDGMEGVGGGAEAMEGEGSPMMPDETPVATPWEWAILAGSVPGALLGVVSFGLTALAMGIVAIWHWWRGGAARRGLMGAAVGVSAIGLVAGVWLGPVIWLGKPVYWWMAR